jgi:hypothetical protein
MKKLILITILAMYSMCIIAQDTSKKVEMPQVNTTITATTLDSINAVKDWSSELKTNIFGDILTPIGYVSCFIFVFFGLIIKWYVQTRKGIKTNPRTPVKFNFKYWFWDNLLPKLQSLLVSGIIIFVCLRFSVEWFKMLPSMLFALGIGLGFDFLIDFVKSKIPDIIKAKETFIKENQENTTPPV